MTEEATSPARFPADIAALFDDAQRRTIALFREVKAAVGPGMTERDIVDLMEARANGHGFDRWFDRPHVRFHAPRRMPHLPDGEDKSRVGTIVEIDAGPADADAYGDFGTAFVIGDGPEPDVVRQSRELLRACCGFASRWKCTGEVFVYADAWARNRALTLGDSNSVGHVCFPRLGRTAPLWPTLARAAIVARRHQVQWFNHRRMHGLYALQPRLVAGENGCGFEEMILIDGDSKRALGRDSFDEIGSL
ncbi:MAG: M24 family metallopeptidase [Myxococcota bacterium]|nr:M24 family metallopeptidase [Myxococcota bacterium]